MNGKIAQVAKGGGALSQCTHVINKGHCVVTLAFSTMLLHIIEAPVAC